MDNLHHKPIKKFKIDGNIKDESAMWRLKTEYQRLLVVEMRLAGYVPRLDINHDFTISYNQLKENFEFILTMYGVYVGKRQSQWIEGIDETRLVYTLRNKSDVSSQVVG